MSRNHKWSETLPGTGTIKAGQNVNYLLILEIILKCKNIIKINLNLIVFM